MQIINPLAERYAEGISSPEDPVLAAISEENRKHPQAHMLSGQVQGKFLEMVSLLMKPLFVLDIGSFMGYSALCLARGLAEGGELHTIEIREDQAEQAEAHFRRANLGKRIILHRGNALNIIPVLDKQWDLVFMDADKTGYEAYYRMILPRLRPRGLIIADNALFHGEVMEEKARGKNARAVHAFNELVKTDKSVDKVLLTVRDGLLLIRKKEPTCAQGE